MSDNTEADHTADRTKHLEMIQDVVSRLAGNSATMKRYCIVMVAAGVAIYKTMDEPRIIGAVALMVVVFWLLDARYLQQEKWFRDLYDQVRVERFDQRPDFRLTLDQSIKEATSFRERARSWSAAGLYLPLVVLLLIFWGTV